MHGCWLWWVVGGGLRESLKWGDGKGDGFGEMFSINERLLVECKMFG